MNKKLMEILTELRCSQNKHITGDVRQVHDQIKALIISNLEKNITPLLLKNRPENELHWGIYLGDSKEKAIIELRKKITKGE